MKREELRNKTRVNEVEMREDPTTTTTTYIYKCMFYKI